MHGAVFTQRAPFDAADAAGATGTKPGHAGLHVSARVAAQFPAGLPRDPFDGSQSCCWITRHNAVRANGVDRVQRSQIHHHASVCGDALPIVAGAGSAQRQGNSSLVRPPDQGNDLVSGGRLDHHFGQLVRKVSLENGRVPVEVPAQGFESLGSGDDALGGEEFGQGGEISSSHAGIGTEEREVGAAEISLGRPTASPGSGVTSARAPWP